MQISSLSCGTGGWGGPKPGDPDNFSVLTASPAFGGIDVKWTLPLTNAHAVAHTYVYRGVSDVFEQATRVATVNSDYFADRGDHMNTPITYYYWIQFVSINGTIGEVIGPASAVARPAIDDVIRGLTGLIDSGLLAENLRTQIDRIPQLKLEIEEARDFLINEDEALASVMEAIQNALDDTAAALVNEAIIREEDNSALVANISALQTNVNDNKALILQEAEVRSTQNSAMASDISALYTEVEDANTLIANVLQTSNDGDAAITSMVNSLRSQVEDNEALILSEGTTRATAIDALATRMDGIQTEVNDNRTSISSAAEAWTNDSEAIGLRIDGLQASVTNSFSDVNATIAAESQVRADNVSALTSRMDTMQTSIDDAEAAIIAEAQTRVTERTADTLRMDGMQSSIDDNNAAIIAEASTRASERDAATSRMDGMQSSIDDVAASVVNEANTRATEISSLASQISTTQSALNDDIASVRAEAQTWVNTLTNGTVKDLGALYTAKVDVNGLVGGFGVYNDGTTVEAGFDVDRFWIGRTTADMKKPFIIENEEVFINQAVVNKITFNKLVDTSGEFLVENGKIRAQYLQAHAITADMIGVGTYEVGRDGDGQIQSIGKDGRDGNGFFFKSQNSGRSIIDLRAGESYLWLDHDPLENSSTGAININNSFYADHTGYMRIDAVDVLGTLQLRGNSVTAKEVYSFDLWDINAGESGVKYSIDIPGDGWCLVALRTGGGLQSGHWTSPTIRYTIGKTLLFEDEVDYMFSGQYFWDDMVPGMFTGGDEIYFANEAYMINLDNGRNFTFYLEREPGRSAIIREFCELIVIKSYK